ncbi:MAG: DUF3727 domain-containing protein [Leptolyngbya sp. SIO1E4]|nr:DUF3727 domain-containing protein [Leptolyngbya sp. SIO1E4]
MTFSKHAPNGPTIALTDASGNSLMCQVEQKFDIEGQQYALLLPVDTPVEIFMWEADASGEEESLVDIEETQIEALFPIARAVLAEQDLMLQHTAITLTVSGDIPDPEEADCFTLEIEDEEDEEGDLLSEAFQTLATFFHEEVEYTVCTPVDPLLLFAQITETGNGQVIPPEEFERLRPEIESTIFDVLE